MGHRDLKNSARGARSSGASRRGGGGVMMGVIIGLIVGVAAVVGVVMYFNRAGTPFTNLQKMEHTASGAQGAATTQVLSPGISINEASGAGNGPVDAPPPPGQAEALPAAPPATAPAAAPAGTAPSAAARPQQPPAAKTGKDGQRFDFYKILPGQVDAVTSDDRAGAVSAHTDASTPKKPYLQLGAFQNQDDADNLKAKLALAGIEATIQSVEVPGKGLVHRVRIGPFSRQEDIDRVRAQLRQNGIETQSRAAN